MSLDPCQDFVHGPTGDFHTRNSIRLPPILGLKSAYDQNAEGVERKENGNTVYIALDPSRPADFTAGLGLLGQKRFYCFLRLTECLSWTGN